MGGLLGVPPNFIFKKEKEKGEISAHMRVNAKYGGQGPEYCLGSVSYFYSPTTFTFCTPKRHFQTISDEKGALHRNSLNSIYLSSLSMGGEFRWHRCLIISNIYPIEYILKS